MLRFSRLLALAIAFLSLNTICYAQQKIEAGQSLAAVSIPSIHLPVELLSFTATPVGTDVLLKWDLANEVNIDFYEIEVAKNSTNFEPVVKIASRDEVGNGAKQSYNHHYEMQPGSKYLFRLKMVDKSGSFLTSYIRTINCAAKGPINILLSPNPVVSNVRLTGMREGDNLISVCDATGMRMMAFHTTQTEASIDLSSYLPGIYNIIVQDATGVAISRRVLKN